jgi:arginyl-tRNA synthetase
LKLRSPSLEQNQISYISTLLSAITNQPLETVSRSLTRPKTAKLGDWSFPCFEQAKALKKAPPAVAVDVKDALDKVSPESRSGIEKIEAVGPYLNFFLKRSFWNEAVIKNIFSAKDGVAKKESNHKKIVLEYSSPNIAKTIHVGHLRTTLIGASLDRIFRHRGYDVSSVNHLGDWGTQFGFVFAGATLFGKPENASVDELVDLYIKATNLRKLQDMKQVPEDQKHHPVVNEMARDYFIRLEAGDTEATEFWKWCLDISVTYLKAAYTRLGIHFDYYTGESFYKDMVPMVEEKIRASGILEDSRGALGVTLDEELGFVRVFAEDGRSLYITRDIAAAMYRHDHFKPERNLYIVAAQQMLHFKQLKAIMEKMGHPSANEIVHIPFGFVPGMKTREGGAISLKLFLDEAYAKALDAYRNQVTKKPEGLDENEVAEKVSIGSTYFYFLSHSNIKDFNFNWDEALSFQGDTGPYCQYALARLNSIIAKASAEGITPLPENFGEYLLDDASHEICSILSKFDATLDKITEDYEPNHLANFILELSKTISKVYKHLRVIGEEEHVSRTRLGLFVASRDTLRTALYLLGMPTVERM